MPASRRRTRRAGEASLRRRPQARSGWGTHGPIGCHAPLPQRRPEPLGAGGPAGCPGVGRVVQPGSQHACDGGACRQRRRSPGRWLLSRCRFGGRAARGGSAGSARDLRGCRGSSSCVGGRDRRARRAARGRADLRRSVRLRTPRRALRARGQGLHTGRHRAFLRGSGRRAPRRCGELRVRPPRRAAPCAPRRALRPAPPVFARPSRCASSRPSLPALSREGLARHRLLLRPHA